jgi:hypothetical protein
VEPISITPTTIGEQTGLVLQPRGWEDLSVKVLAPAACSYLKGHTGDADAQRAYNSVQTRPGGKVLGVSNWVCGDHAFSLSDAWSGAGEGKVRLERRLTVSQRDGTEAGIGDGFQMHIGFGLASAPASASDDWRFFAPGILYSPGQFSGRSTVTFSDNRLAYPLILAYQLSSGRAVCASRVQTAAFDKQAMGPNRLIGVS